jgi:hypothetical protein
MDEKRPESKLRLVPKNAIIVSFIYRYLLMAMRPDVRRHTIVIVVFAIVQWAFMRYILNEQLFNLTTYERIVYFSTSSFIGAFAIIAAFIYMVIKGNSER